MSKNMLGVWPNLTREETLCVRSAMVHQGRWVSFRGKDIPLEAILFAPAQEILQCLILWHLWNPIPSEATAIQKLQAHLGGTDGHKSDEDNLKI